MKSLIYAAVFIIGRAGGAYAGTAAGRPELNAVSKADIIAAMDAVSFPEPLPLGGNKIIGGERAAEGEFSFIVSLRDNLHGHFCGGTLIRKDWVLTAAHCAGNIPDGMETVFTGVDFQMGRDDEGAERFVADRIIPHPDYNAKTSDYDFALLHLKGESRFAPAALNRKELSGRVDFVVAGWGVMTWSDSPWSSPSLSYTLKKVTVPLVSAAVCSRSYPSMITDRMLCAGFKEGGKDACQGDSGGPLVTGAGADRVLAGVVSVGGGCAQPNQYGVYAKVSSVLPWIDGIIK